MIFYIELYCSIILIRVRVHLFFEPIHTRLHTRKILYTQENTQKIDVPITVFMIKIWNFNSGKWSKTVNH